MSRRINMHLDEEFAETIELHKPKSLALAAFCALLIEEALDKRLEPQTMGEPAARRASSSTSKKVSTTKSVIGAIPEELADHAELIKDFWRVKKGSKGDVAWKLLMGELGKIRAKYGDAVVTEQLQLGINGKWNGIQLSNYEKFSVKPGAKEPEVNHPAYRSADQVLAEQKRIEEQNLAHLRAKQQERDEIASGRGVLNQIFDAGF